jgi:hypothetical protein
MFTPFRCLILSNAVMMIAPALADPPVAPADSGKVTTRLTIPLSGGSIDATFVARSTANGGWDIDADCHPRDVIIWFWDTPLYELRGKGHGSVSAVPDVPVVITVTGWHWQSLVKGLESFPAMLEFTIVVDANGVVRLS